MKIAFQINKIETLNQTTDTSLSIMQECLKRGYYVVFYYPENLNFKDGKVYALGFKFDGTQTEKGEKTHILLDDYDVVFLRQDPPFDMAYITTTYLLEKLKKAKVLNNPASVRNCPEKLFVLDFLHFMPKTLITSDESEIRTFWQENGEIILKPLYSFAGDGVFYIPKEDKNLRNAIRILKAHYGGMPIIAQAYIPKVSLGDKRILFINGEFAGALNRVQAQNSAISNTASGGRPEVTTLTTKEKEMCEALKPIFKQLGLFLVGIDVIDDQITEINVTSPTGFVLLNRLYNKNLQEKIVDEMLKL